MGIIMPITRVISIQYDKIFALSGPWKTLYKCLFMFAKHKSHLGTYPGGNDSPPNGSTDLWRHLFGIILVSTQMSPPWGGLPRPPSLKKPPPSHSLSLPSAEWPVIPGGLELWALGGYGPFCAKIRTVLYRSPPHIIQLFIFSLPLN